MKQPTALQLVMDCNFVLAKKILSGYFNKDYVFYIKKDTVYFISGIFL